MGPIKYTKEEIAKEKNQILQLIKETNKIPQKKIAEHHLLIISRLDFNEIINTPSPLHRCLHEAILISSHEVYEKMDKLNADVDFTKSSSRERFDVKYAKKYLWGSLELDDWGKTMLTRAEVECERKYGRSLGEVSVEEI